MIFIGTKNDKFNSLFYTGIITLILNIIVQLFEYWERIPWFVYTLIAGLGIIFYVTYKEFNKDKKPKVKESKVEYYQEKQYNVRNNIVTVGLFIVYLIVMGVYLYNIDYIKEQLKNTETEEKFKELGLDENIYYFSNKNYPILYILEGNSTNLEKVYNLMKEVDEDYYKLHVCWVDEEGMSNAKINNNNDRYYNNCLNDLYYYGYEDKPDMSYSTNGFTLTVSNENLYDFNIWRNSSYKYDASFDITYNTNETRDISFCVTHHSIDEYNVFVEASEYEAINGSENCFKASDEYGNIRVDVQKKPEPVEDIPTFDSYTKYDPVTGEPIYFN